jgi:GNAT superfamily N-acetyltransferase
MIRAETSLEIRDLNGADAVRFKRLLLGLDGKSRCSRFGMMVSDGRLLEHARLAFENTLWFGGAFLDCELRGAAELYATEDPHVGEIAFVVEVGWRRRGVASALLEAAAAWAPAEGIERIRMVCSRRDWPMRLLASHADARLDLMMGDFVAETQVGRPSPRATSGDRDVLIGLRAAANYERSLQANPTNAGT